MLHGRVDNGDNRYVSHITDVLIDQELKVGNVNDSEITMINIYLFKYLWVCVRSVPFRRVTPTLKKGKN